MKLILSFFLVLLFSISLFSQKVFVTKPYLQIGHNPSSTSLQLLWHADDIDANWRVEYKKEANSDWIKADSLFSNKVIVEGIAPHEVFHVSLKNLISGSKFTYRVLKDKEEVFSAEATAPKSQNQPSRFVAIGDIGAEKPDQKALAGRIFLEKPDYVVVPGDIVYDSGRIHEYDKRFWPIYNQDKLDASGAPIMRSIPFVAAVGNHDADSRDLDQKPDALAYHIFWEQPLNGPLGVEGGPFVPELKGSTVNKEAFLKAAGKTYPRMTNFSFNYGNAHWTVLDSDTYVDWTNKELQDWVKKDLEDAKNATWRFVLYHHPGIQSSREHFEQQQMRLLSPSFEAGKVDVVFNGHVHNYQRTFPMTFLPDDGTLIVGGKNKSVTGRVINGKWTLDKTFDGINNTSPKGVIYVVTGAGGADLYNKEQQTDPESWQKFTDKFISKVHSLTVADVNGKTLKIRQLQADGKVLDEFTITK